MRAMSIFPSGCSGVSGNAVLAGVPRAVEIQRPVDTLPHPGCAASALRDEPIARVQVLVGDEDLMDIERMCRSAGQMVAHDLKNMAQPCRIVDVDVGTTFGAVLEECHLQVPERVQRLEAAGGDESGRRLVQRSV